MTVVLAGQSSEAFEEVGDEQVCLDSGGARQRILGVAFSLVWFTRAAADYTAILIKASDITLPGDIFTGQPPIQNPSGQPGVAQMFGNQNDTRHVGVTILILARS